MSTDIMSTMTIHSYEDIKDSLRVRLMDERANAEVLANAVWEPVDCGFALVAYMVLPDEIAEGGVANVPRKAVLALGLDDRTVMQDAKAGSLAHEAPKLCTMRSMLFGGPPENLLTDPAPGEGTDFLVLTTEEGRLGASAICYPEMTEKIGQIVGGDYFVLPSSIHEVLILPDRAGMSPDELLKMVREVNEAEVLPEERLADRVMFFRNDLQRMEVAADFVRGRERGEER